MLEAAVVVTFGKQLLAVFWCERSTLLVLLHFLAKPQMDSGHFKKAALWCSEC